jgi:hypothetical protein
MPVSLRLAAKTGIVAELDAPMGLHPISYDPGKFWSQGEP